MKMKFGYMMMPMMMMMRMMMMMMKVAMIIMIMMVTTTKKRVMEAMMECQIGRVRVQIGGAKRFYFQNVPTKRIMPCMILISSQSLRMAVKAAVRVLVAVVAMTKALEVVAVALVA